MMGLLLMTGKWKKSGSFALEPPFPNLSSKRFESWRADSLYSASQNLRFPHPENIK